MTAKGQPGKRKPLSERFWDKVDKKSPSECWIWKGAPGKNGYGSLRTVPGQRTQAHKVSWLLHFGSMPWNGKVSAKDDTCILHECDNKMCVNPLHLHIGTRNQNQSEMAERGRVSRGNLHPNAKINEDLVRKIRSMNSQGLRPFQIAKDLGVRRMIIQRVVSGKTWRHVK